MKALPLLLASVLSATAIAAQAAPDQAARQRALRALCPIGLKAGGIWGDEHINAAIATIDSGTNWPDSAQATAYNVCNYGGYLR